MGLFSKLFDKKQCAICGGDIGLLGNRKLSDGNMCKNCASLLSPFMTDRKECTVAEIEQHLQYRMENKAEVDVFNPTRALGNRTKVYIDDNTGRFLVSNDPNWRRDNPDIISVDQVLACDLIVRDHRSERYDRTPDGRRVSFNPPQFDYKFEFYIHMSINSPYFNEIGFELTDRRPESPYDEFYAAYEQQGYEIQCALMPYTEVPYPVNRYIGLPEFSMFRPAPTVISGRPAPMPRQAAPAPRQTAPTPPRPAQPAPRPAAPQPTQPRPVAPQRPASQPAPQQRTAAPQRPANQPAPQSRPQQGQTQRPASQPQRPQPGQPQRPGNGGGRGK